MGIKVFNAIRRTPYVLFFPSRVEQKSACEIFVTVMMMMMLTLLKAMGILILAACQNDCSQNWTEA